MKALKYIGIGFLIALTSCEGLLDEPIYDLRDPALAYASEGSTMAMTLGMYKAMQGYNYMSGHYMGMLTMNGAWTTRRAGGTEEYAQLTQHPGLVWGEKMYSAIYSAIAQTNVILFSADSTSEEEFVRNARGQAHFLRALHYFNLARVYGPVPIVTSVPGNLAETNVPRAESIQPVYDMILSDLDKAHELIPEVQTNGVAPKKEAAWAMKAKVYAQLASMCEDKEAFGLGEDVDAMTYWGLARDFADSVIQSGVYSLYPDYTMLFDMENEFTEESIVEISFSAAPEVGNAFTHFLAPHNSGWSSNGTGGWGRMVPSREMYDTVLATTGGIDARMTTNMVQEYLRIDGKTAQTYPALGKEGADVYYKYPFFQKYKDPNGLDNNTHGNNFIYLRYADILLTYAEAVNELQGPVSDAVNALNEILARSRASGVGNTIPKDVYLGQYTTNEGFRDRIMTERLCELMGEAHEWYDARRRGRAYFKTICDNHNSRLDQAEDEGVFDTKSDYYFPVDDFSLRKNLWLPIPQAEINTNEAIDYSDQNFGY